MNDTKHRSITAYDVAAYFVRLDDARDIEDGITNLKLQKLVYYAQGYHLAYFGTPLFSNHIEAWQYGPVVPELYTKLSCFGRNPVDLDQLEAKLGYTLAEFSFAGETKSLLDSVFEQLGQFSAWKLMEMTHKEEPWKSTPLREEITNSKLRAYFSSQIG